MNIKKQICSNWSEREGHKPEIIVVHISTGTLASMTSWFNTPSSFASAHYAVGKDGTILQYVEDEKKAWANGKVNNPTFKLYKPNINPNLYTLSIENEGTDLAKAPQTQLNALGELLTHLCDKWVIPRDREHILGHFEIDEMNRINCPSPNHSIMEKIVAMIQPPLPISTKDILLKIIEELKKLVENL